MASASSKPLIVYVADPMCSWCWAFSPHITTLRDQFSGQIDFQLVAGGLRSFTTPMSTQDAARLGHYWQGVMERSGQRFNTAFSPPPGFAYNTEPACRALVCVRELNAGLQFAYLAALHAAFYIAHQDITQPQVLAAVAVSQGIAETQFLELWHSQRMLAATQADIAQRLEWGVDGFPSLLWDDQKRLQGVAQGYQTTTTLVPRIQALLDEYQGGPPL